MYIYIYLYVCIYIYIDIYFTDRVVSLRSRMAASEQGQLPPMKWPVRGHSLEVPSLLYFWWVGGF